MDLGCSCVCDVDHDPASVLEEKMVKARKEHECCECGETIKRGERYELVKGCWDGSWGTYKTCEPCVRIRRDVCCNSWIYGELRETIWEAFDFDYVTGKWNTWGDEEEEE